MDINSYLNNLNSGVYEIPPKPKTNLNDVIRLRETENEILKQIPKVIDEDKSVVWNRKEIDKIIAKKVAHPISQESSDIYYWLNKEREIITKKYNDLMEAFIEEFQLSENQIEYIIEKIFRTSIVHLDIETIDEFEDFRTIVENIKNFNDVK